MNWGIRIILNEGKTTNKWSESEHFFNYYL